MNRRKLDSLREDYVKGLDELLNLAELARQGIQEAARDLRAEIPLRITVHDNWRRFRREKGRIERRLKKRRRRQCVLFR